MSDIAEGDPVFTSLSAYSLALVVACMLVAYGSSYWALPPTVNPRKSRAIYTWLFYDALTHFIFEGSFLWTSTFGRTAETGTDWAAAMWREYGKADYRWAVADPTIVSLEILTVFICGPMCLLILRKLCTRQERARHFWTIVLSTMELYGGGMTFFPTWLAGSDDLRTDSKSLASLGVFGTDEVRLSLSRMMRDPGFHADIAGGHSGIWVVVPLWLLWDSYRALISFAPVPSFKIEPSTPEPDHRKVR